MNITTLDFQVLDWIQLHLQCAFLDWLMPKITVLGNGGVIWIIIAVVLVCHRKTRCIGLTMGTGMLCGLVLGNGILKNLVQRDRPCWIRSVELLIAMPEDYSFPLGHTLSSFIAATVLFQYNRKAGIAAYALAISIAFSRIYLYVHFPSDVLFAVAFGILIGILVNHAGKKDDAKNAKIPSIFFFEKYLRKYLIFSFKCIIIKKVIIRHRTK